MFCVLHRRNSGLLKDERGAALVEFAIALPLLVVFVVGIYDFSGAYNQKLKIGQAAQGGAIIAGAQPMSDIQQANGNPDSLQPVVVAVFNSLANSGVLPNGNTGGGCSMPPPVPAQVPPPPALSWQYTIYGCNNIPFASDQLVITINRAVPSPGLAAISTTVTVTFPYHWRFGSAIQLLFPGPNGYSAPAALTESATVQNQL